MTQSELGYLLALARFPKFGAVRIAKLRNSFSTFESVFSAERDELLRSGVEPAAIDAFLLSKDRLNPEKELEILRTTNVTAIAYGDEDYPELLKEIFDPPAVLFVRGTMPTAGELTLAVVGTRKPTRYGDQVVRDFVEPIAREGVVVVSGLAYGIDALAHQAACRAEGKTVAVLGTGVDADSVYPVRNRSLSSHIIATGGALISEFPVGTTVRKENFPFRNRIIAGMSLGTLVVEAAQKSGSLITARAALEANREVYAVPGSIHSPMSVGPNNLIKMGAHPVTAADDVISALGISKTQETPAPRAGSPNEEKILCVLGKEPLHIDEIIRKTQLESPAANSTLTLMEMKGSARHVGGMYYVVG